MSRSAFEKFKKGESLTRKQSMAAMCYECNGGSVEMKNDCLGKNCPLYQWSPWGRSLNPRAARHPRSIPQKKIGGV